MSNLPKVTILTPSFNQGQFIEETIKSVLAQSYPNIEYIVLDAMSTDGTLGILERYGKRITKIIREPDGGQSDAIVKGFKAATGELVGWINSDDMLYPDCVERVVNAYRSQDRSVLFYNSRIDILAEDGGRLQTLDIGDVSRRDLLARGCTVVQPGSFYVRDALEAVGYFDASLDYSMDLDLWLRLLAIGDSTNIEGRPYAGYREWGGTKTSTGDAKLLKERRKLLLLHGAGLFAQTVLKINFQLAKLIIKRMYRKVFE